MIMLKILVRIISWPLLFLFFMIVSLLVFEEYSWGIASEDELQTYKKLVKYTFTLGFKK